MEGIKISQRPNLKNPLLLCAWPGMGEVAFKAATYLVEKIQAEEFASIPHADFFYFTASLIQAGIISMPNLPYSKFYFWKNKAGRNDLIIFVSDAQPDLSRAEEYCQRIIRLAKSFNVETVVSFAAIPQPIDHLQKSQVWFSATSVAMKEKLTSYGFNLFSEGTISGMNGLFLGIAKSQGLEGFCLLGEIPLYTIQIENPKAAYAVLEALSKIINVSFDLTALIEQAHTMETEINKLFEYLKLSPTLGPIEEEDIERIKKTLSQLTKLPTSVKDKIEKLFAEARADILKAQELKAELDKWNVYKEYEDRFLDLFKRTKEKDN